MEGISLQQTSPSIHSSKKNLKASTGTQVTRSNKSPAARLEMKILGTLLIALFVIKIFTKVILPRSPTMIMIKYKEGITHRIMKNAISLLWGRDVSGSMLGTS
ncbi:hypothetical protein GDO81_008232 [Engystomops pustulosus]|uniref:Uncharacterized protein n=1 Tax=Engystomops pustulosus TaxID=76066 RepID=A0AAV7CD25_ENGPU|nr:hypothetical protein GDO81_008232 [Engystomops pustulosus]